ncbi:MAG: hypothetical protein IAE82_21720 [Opitutaceae bacterium]|nr:hypothetical protein [Opitutaceae bacterium]
MNYSSAMRQSLRCLCLVAVVATGSSTNLSAATTLNQFGITWTWNEDRQVGQFANGDYWVVGPITLTSITPADTNLSDSTDINGSEINPSGCSQGYDSRAPSYQQSLNISRKLPLSVAAGSSIVSHISLSAAVSDATNQPQISDTAILTVVASAPASGTMRPPYCGTNKSLNWNISSFNYGLLGNLAPVAGAPTFGSAASAFERPWEERCGYAFGRVMQATNNGPTYGRDRTSMIERAALALQLQGTNAEKQLLLVRLVQYGLDIFGAEQTGSEWEANGGHGSGRKFPMVLAGVMLNDPAILARCNAAVCFDFGEDQNCFVISNSDVGRGSTGYTSDMVGTAEWGIKHYHTPADDRASWGATYRDVVGSQMVGIILAARIMKLETIWNWAPTFAYYDRYWTNEQSQRGSGTNEIDSFTAAMWDAYRNSGPVGTTPPPAPSNALLGP